MEIASKNKSKTRRFDCQFPARATLAFDFFSIYDRLAHLDREEISRQLGVADASTGIIGFHGFLI